MSELRLRIGELARRTGVTVRTLHHYHDIGLLAPATRSGSGHRLYGEDQVRRLQQIVSLRDLGLSLGEIRTSLADQECSLAIVLQQHVDRLQTQIEHQRALCLRLSHLLTRLGKHGAISADELIETIEETVMYSKYYSEEQQAELERRRVEVGGERIEQVQNEWKELFAQLDAEWKRGTDPADEAAQVLARKAQSLIDEFTNRDPAMEQSLGNVYQGEGGGSKVMAQQGWSIDPGVFEYMNKAIAAMKEAT